MSKLRISDAPLLPDVSGLEKIPTGGRGDLAISMDQVKTFAQGGLPQQIENHINDTENPHQVSKSQVGLGSVDNTSDLDKPVSTAQQEALNLKADKVTTYTKIEVDSRLGLKADKTAVHSKSATLPTYYVKEDGVNSETGVASGAYFNVHSSSDDTVLDEYQNVGGVATPTGKSYPSSNALNNIPHNNLKNRDAAEAHPASAILDESGRNQQEKNKDFVFVEDYYAKGGALRPVSDLYTTGSDVYQKRFKNFSDVQAFFPFVTAATDPLDWAATQKAVNENVHVRMRGVFYYWGAKTVELPISCLYFHGTGIMTRIYTTGLRALKVKDGVRIVHGDFGHFYLVGNNTPNSIGFDTSAFSYCTFQNIWIRQFNDGWYADGSTSPVNKQYSNNTVINVRSNNNLRDGFRFVGSSEANSANIYIGCEGAQNANVGFNELVGYSNQIIGCTFQGNTVFDLYTDGQRNIYQYYAEGNPKSTKLGPLSSGNTISIRSSYPLWNSFINNGRNNNVSVRGELDIDQHVFFNPFFEDWVAANPTHVLPNGTPIFSWFSDTNLPKGGGLQAVFNANSQGLSVRGLDTSIDYSGRWVTVQIEADTSGIVDLGGLRVYARDGSVSNTAAGAFAVTPWVQTVAGKYKNFTFDVKFADSTISTPNILIYLAYSGITTENTIKIKSIKVILGQKDRVSDYALSALPLNSIGANFTSATSGLNTAWKKTGRFAYNTTAGKLYYASGTTPTSAWKALDGTADIVPS